MNEQNDKIFELATVLTVLATQHHEYMEMYKNGVRWVEQNEDSTLVPVIPDNVLLFPTHRRMQ